MAELRFAQGCPTSRAPEGPGKVASGWGVGVRGEPSWLLPAPPAPQPRPLHRAPGGMLGTQLRGSPRQPSANRQGGTLGHSDGLLTGEEEVQGPRVTESWEGAGKNLRDVQMLREKVKTIQVPSEADEAPSKPAVVWNKTGMVEAKRRECEVRHQILQVHTLNSTVCKLHLRF